MDTHWTGEPPHSVTIDDCCSGAFILLEIPYLFNESYQLFFLLASQIDSKSPIDSIHGVWLSRSAFTTPLLSATVRVQLFPVLAATLLQHVCVWIDGKAQETIEPTYLRNLLGRSMAEWAADRTVINAVLLHSFCEPCTASTLIRSLS